MQHILITILTVTYPAGGKLVWRGISLVTFPMLVKSRPDVILVIKGLSLKPSSVGKSNTKMLLSLKLLYDRNQSEGGLDASKNASQVSHSMNENIEFPAI